MKLIALIPAFLFVLLLVILGVGLTRDPRKVESPLVGKPVPDFTLPTLYEPDKSFSINELRGEIYLLNVWASWCFACRAEHNMLLDIQRDGAVPIYGFNYKDDRNDALRWLNELGNPYTENIADINGRVAIDLGVYGAPETFLVDRDGIIVHKQIGPIDGIVWQKEILPLIQRLKAESP